MVCSPDDGTFQVRSDTRIYFEDLPMAGVPMRVCLVSNLYPPEVIGGAEKHVRTVAEELVAREHEVHVITSSESAPHLEFKSTDQNGVIVHRFKPLNLYSPIQHPEEPAWKKPIQHAIDLWNLHSFRMVRSQITSLSPDIVHIHNFGGLSGAVFPAASTGAPVIHTLHDYGLLCIYPSMFRAGSVIEPGPLSLLYQKWNKRSICPHIDKVLSPSQFMINKHQEYGFFEATESSVLRLGINHTGSFDSHEKGPPFRVLYAGQLTKSKGVDILISAMEQFNGEQVQLDILGKGPYQGKLESLAAELSNIKFHGFVSEETLHDFYSRADVTVVPSRWYDNSPMVLYESYMHGTPVIGADIGGIPELIKDGKTGYVFPPEDSNALVEAIRKLKNNSVDDFQEQIRSMRSSLTLENHVNNLVDIYRNVLL